MKPCRVAQRLACRMDLGCQAPLDSNDLLKYKITNFVHRIVLCVPVVALYSVVVGLRIVAVVANEDDLG